MLSFCRLKHGRLWIFCACRHFYYMKNFLRSFPSLIFYVFENIFAAIMLRSFTKKESSTKLLLTVTENHLLRPPGVRVERKKVCCDLNKCKFCLSSQEFNPSFTDKFLDTNKNSNVKWASIIPSLNQGQQEAFRLRKYAVKKLIFFHLQFCQPNPLPIKILNFPFWKQVPTSLF